MVDVIISMIVGSNFDRSLIHKIFKRSIHFLDWAFFIWGHPVPEMRRKKAPHFGTGLRHPLYPVVLRKAKNGMFEIMSVITNIKRVLCFRTRTFFW